MTLAEVEQRYAKAERDFDRRVGQAKAIVEQGKQAQAEVDDLTDGIAALDEAVVLLNSYADERQEEVRTRIETLVSHGLQTIFDEDMHFVVQTRQVAKRSEVDFLIRSPGPDGQTIETPILEARGGGVAAVAGFLLQLIILLLRRDSRKTLFLDEAFAQLSEEYEPRLADFMRELVDKTECQLLLVTHSRAYDDAADVMYRFSQRDGVTQVMADDARVPAG